MATIASNVLMGGARGASKSAPADDSHASEKPNDFMQLVQGMIQGNTSGDQLPSNLLELLLTGDSGGLDGILDAASSKDGDSTDDDGSDDAAAAAASGLAALLAGLQTQPAANASTAAGDNSAVGSINGTGSQKDQMLQALMATTQGAVEGAVGAAIDAAADAASARGADGKNAGLDPNAINGANNPNGAAHLQNTLLAHRAADMAPQAASAEVRTPVGQQGWGDEIGTHLAIMAANGREAASLRLSPEHLGPLEVQISMKDGQANVVFGASNPETRNALEQSLPRLREMFAAQGLTLGNANVSRDAPRDSHKPASFTQGTRGSSDASADLTVKRVTLSRLGLVDTYV
jgi:flagellar hook-length control protein FliK